MLALRKRIKEVAPEVVVCQNDAYKLYAEKLLAGLNIPVIVLSRDTLNGGLFRETRAVWLGADKHPSLNRYYFVFSYVGGVSCS